MTILFDLDDTLLDHTAAFDAGTSALYAHVGPDRSLEDFAVRWEAALRRHYDRYLAGELTYDQQRCERVRDVVDGSLSDSEATRVYSTYLEAYEAAWELFPDAETALAQLGGHSLGIITNGQVAQQRRKMERTGLLSRVDCTVISEEFGAAKPDPAIFRHACALLRAAPEDVPYIGDRYDVDALAARHAGLTGIWLDRRRTKAAGHQPPVIHTLADLPGLLASIRVDRG